MTTTRAEIRDAIAARLVAGLPRLGGRVYTSRVWPLPAAGLVDAGAMPAALVYALRTRRTSLSIGTAAPTFRAIVTFVVMLRAEGTNDVAVDLLLDDLGEAAEDVLMTDPSFVALAEEIAGLDSERRTTKDSERTIGEEALSIDMQFTETFEPKGLPPLTTANVVIDAIDPADQAGAYPAIDPFPAPAAPPRQQGPDGRPEAAPLTITFPES
ncbi:hypothetical protein [Neoroseomonas lacus]|uniref:Uncharacterized protein n=1 Tax=Neoroseomonas lacus TaxID=287609 RepID=A0A917KJW7_9PROT|nr:hypothetical protein [Neoroseomonas lacus]GGJ14192.1 hypothetical protein GCM10011320_21820 [Neoroseomonas lacus]